MACYSYYTNSAFIILIMLSLYRRIRHPGIHRQRSVGATGMGRVGALYDQQFGGSALAQFLDYSA